MKFQHTDCKVCILTYQMWQTGIKLQNEERVTQERDTCHFGPIFFNLLELQPEEENLFFKTLLFGVKKAYVILSCLPEILCITFMSQLYSHTHIALYTMQYSCITGQTCALRNRCLKQNYYRMQVFMSKTKFQ